MSPRVGCRLYTKHLQCFRKSKRLVVPIKFNCQKNFGHRSYGFSAARALWSNTISFFFSMCGDKILIFGLIRKTLIVTLTILHGIKPKKQNEWSELSLLNLKPDLSTVSTSSNS